MKRILIVGMLDSIHLARWLENFSSQDLIISLFPSGPSRKIHPRIVELAKASKVIRIPAFAKKNQSITWLVDQFLNRQLRKKKLIREIEDFNPHIVHALEFQHAGYLVRRVIENIDVDFDFIATNYGSDISWFGRKRRHRKEITSLLEVADQYSCECSRDLKLALDFGFKGVLKPVFPNSGPLDVKISEQDDRQRLNRKILIVKGYQSWAGRFLLALAAIVSTRQKLKDLTIVVFSANQISKAFSLLAKSFYKLDIHVFIKGELSHEKMLELFKNSRIYLGVSATDGISTSALEAAAHGAFVIQSGTSCVMEYLQTPQLGTKLTNNKINSIAKALTDALSICQGDWVEQTARLRASISQSSFEDQIKNFYFDGVEVNKD